MLRHVRIAIFALLAVLALAAPAAAQNFPALTGRVVDQAGILDASTRAALTDKLKALEVQNTDQLVVATVKSLGGRSVEDYANRLFRQWRLGQKDKNNGVLLLVAPTQRKMRIEVGYGLEGRLTDAVAKVIIENTMVPDFRAGDIAGGIVHGVDAISEVLTGNSAFWQNLAVTTPPSTRPPGGPQPMPDWMLKASLGIMGLVFVFVAGLLLWFVGIVVATVLVSLGVLPRQRDRKGGWLWLNYLNTDPDFDPRHPERARSRHRSSLSSSRSSSSSSSSDSFSGGGGSSGGGGASGSW